MSRKNRIRGDVAPSADRRIQANSPGDTLQELLRFSFKFYEPNHADFHCHDREADYFKTLLDRIKALSMEKCGDLTNCKANRATRFHPIDFAKKNVSKDGFGIPGWEQYNESAWQFSLSKSLHGRVHGFLIENVFYVVWLDPQHLLYPGN